MINVASLDDLTTEIYNSFILRNSCLNLDDDMLQYWEMPWLFYTANLFTSKKILCLGEKSNLFYSLLINEGKNKGIYLYHNSTNSKNYIKYDLIIGLRLFRSIDENKRLALLHKMYSLLKPGRRFLFTIEVREINGKLNLNFIKEILQNTKFELFRFNSLFDFNTFLLKLDNYERKNILTSNGNNLVGVVLFKPYSIKTIDNKKYIIKRSWIYNSPKFKKIILESVGFKTLVNSAGIFNNAYHRIFWLPDELVSKDKFGVKDLCEIFNIDKSDAVSLVNEMICKQCFVEI